MPHLNSNRCKPAASAAAVLVLLLACLGLAACGSSSGSSSSTTSASTPATTTTGAKGPNSGRFAAIRECLQKNGITLPQRTPGQRRPPGGAGGFLGGGRRRGWAFMPKGVTRAQYEAVLKKCGGGNFAGGAGRRFNSPAFKAALAKFASCMRENGVNIPAPNTSGKGPVFSTKGLNTSSPKFQAAEVKCRGVLAAAFGVAPAEHPPVAVRRPRPGSRRLTRPRRASRRRREEQLPGRGYPVRPGGRGSPRSSAWRPPSAPAMRRSARTVHSTAPRSACRPPRTAKAPSGQMPPSAPPWRFQLGCAGRPRPAGRRSATCPGVPAWRACSQRRGTSSGWRVDWARIRPAGSAAYESSCR